MEWVLTQFSQSGEQLGPFSCPPSDVISLASIMIRVRSLLGEWFQGHLACQCLLFLLLSCEGGLNYLGNFRPRFVILENVVGLCDVDRQTGVSNADTLYNMMGELGYLLVSAVYDSRRHGSPQRRTRWWGIGIRISNSPLTAADVETYEPYRARILSTLSRIEMNPASISDILLPEDAAQGGGQRCAAPAAVKHSIVYVLGHGLGATSLGGPRGPMYAFRTAQTNV